MGVRPASGKVVWMKQPKAPTDPLPSRPGAGQVVAGILAGIDHLIANRPRAVPQIEEEYRDAWASSNGVSVDGLDDLVERPEPPDTTGARL
jgi:hypothetical protein